jgi:hypothetical protein
VKAKSLEQNNGENEVETLGTEETATSDQNAAEESEEVASCAPPLTDNAAKEPECEKHTEKTESPLMAQGTTVDHDAVKGLEQACESNVQQGEDKTTQESESKPMEQEHVISGDEVDGEVKTGDKKEGDNNAAQKRTAEDKTMEDVGDEEEKGGVENMEEEQESDANQQAEKANEKEDSGDLAVEGEEEQTNGQQSAEQKSAASDVNESEMAASAEQSPPCLSPSGVHELGSLLADKSKEDIEGNSAQDVEENRRPPIVTSDNADVNNVQINAAESAPAEPVSSSPEHCPVLSPISLKNSEDSKTTDAEVVENAAPTHFKNTELNAEAASPMSVKSEDDDNLNLEDDIKKEHEENEEEEEMDHNGQDVEKDKENGLNEDQDATMKEDQESVKGKGMIEDSDVKEEDDMDVKEQSDDDEDLKEEKGCEEKSIETKHDGAKSEEVVPATRRSLRQIHRLEKEETEDGHSSQASSRASSVSKTSIRYLLSFLYFVCVCVCVCVCVF